MMIRNVKTRKRRTDTNHIIYQISRGDDVYIGITVVDKGKVRASLIRRWRKHVNRALTENRDWQLCVAIREHGADAFEIKVLEKIQGKKQAHAKERELLLEQRPSLNTHIRQV